MTLDIGVFHAVFVLCPPPPSPSPRGATQSTMTLQVLCSFLQFIVVGACLPACTLCSVNKRVLRPVPKPRSIGVASKRCKWEAGQGGRQVSRGGWRISGLSATLVCLPCVLRCSCLCLLFPALSLSSLPFSLPLFIPLSLFLSLCLSLLLLV